jgi:murein L,D-transpeptidase YcbB/YkuD
MANQIPAEFPLKRRLPVLIFYMTADIDELGNLKFYNDVYGVENPTEKKAI